MQLLKEIVLELSKLSKESLTNENLHNIKKLFSKKYNIKNLPTNIQLQKTYKEMVNSWEIKENKKLQFLLMKRKIRSLSWIVPIQVLTKPRPCPWQCIFCPNESIMPKSYISTEPWAMRALLNNFDPVKQTYNRLLSLQATWHNTDKIEMIVLWWSFDSYPNDYKIDFIKKLYDACNTFEDIKQFLQINSNKPKEARFTIDLNNLNINFSKSLEESQKINENSKNRIIWLTIETRPDLVSEENIKFRRKLWVTRIEIGIQSTFNEVLKANKRWHTIENVKKALHLIRKYWLKISAHMMPWLYKSNLEKDIKSFEILYSDPYLKPDELKFYPTSVLPNTELYDLYKKWKYKPITDDEIEKIIKYVKTYIIPPYTRIKRLIRDIPSTEIIAWSNITNLRQLVIEKLKKNKNNKKILKTRLRENSKNIKTHIYQINLNDNNLSDIFNNELKNKQNLWIWNFVCLCTRCREIRNNDMLSYNIFLIIREYKSSVWNEYFISFETNNWYIIWFSRLLLPKEFVEREWLWNNTAIVRELHVYWLQEKIWEKWEITQHKWFWKKLMSINEIIAKKYWYKKLSVISWIWVRWFYQKIWYKLEWTYMTKPI